jgi:predicted metal-dependent hydrolase
MAQKTVWLPEIGELVISKRRGTKNLRLSIAANGTIRVGLPAWAPYSAGINFAISRSSWISAQRDKIPKIRLKHGDRIGKSYRIDYIWEASKPKTTTRIKPGMIQITSALAFSDPVVQKAATGAAERAMKKEAQGLLPQRLALLASKHGFSYKSVHIKKLSSRWGSCSNQKVITLNYFLMQLPWPLIDYVLVHELIHTKHLNHSPQFWSDFEKVFPGAKQTRRQIKNYRPILGHS